MVQTPQDEYKRNMLQLKEAAITTSVPVLSELPLVPKCNLPALLSIIKDVLSRPLCPIM